MKRVVAFFLSAVVFAAVCLSSLNISKAQQALAPSKPNPQIEKILSEISAKNIEASLRKLVSFGTRHTLSSQDDPNRGIGAARRWIKAEMDRYSQESGGRLIVTEDDFIQPPTQRVPKEARLVNIVATLPGVQAESKDRIYVVSGHYDSCVCSQGMTDAESDAPGASDDASGTAAVMEMARVMSKYQFDATIVFMTVPGEEQGLLGAAHWAEEAKKKNLNIAAMFTNDIIGNTFGGNGVRDNRRVRLFSEGVPTTETEADARIRQSNGGENDGPSRQLARYIKEIGERYLPNFEVTMVFRRDRYGRGGDHNAFLQRGFPAVRFTEPNEDFTRQHQKVREENGIKYGDVFEMADPIYIAQVARINASAMASMALAPAAPTGVQFKTGRQEYDTTVAWQANKEPDVAGYRIVWRETYQPFWQRSIEVGNVTEFIMKSLSKDDYFFAVQAIDKDGNVSAPAFPTVRRPAR
ncbi:MAG TPA: M28 family metallopeptidase [Blastocatellia bacterium]|nr:M28 family metallopeptidase [Blastocatellia bacterium]HMV85224.1 M28 family metallopeptidase [Blastocatellia bacterium]HMZ18339.1 M28 family metallopeptidase [Blastocatellia bacterium]HNG28672.1 M28 family metallopeptidase [Blastocatellia bacterium]